VSDKILADVINLREIITSVLRNYDISESKCSEISEHIYTQYKNSVKLIATKFLEQEIERRSTLSTFQELVQKEK